MADEIGWDLNLPTEHLKNLLITVLVDNGFQPNSTCLEISSVSAGPWSAFIYRIKASNELKQISLYFKCMSKNVLKIEWLNCNLYFQNEIMFYENVIPAFQKFQKERAPLDSRQPVPVPKCFRTVCDGQNDVIVMEDLSVSDYVVLNHRKPVNIPEIKLIFIQFGRFHGFSLAFKSQRPNIFRETIGNLIEPIFQESLYDKFNRKLMTTACYDVIEILKDELGEDCFYVKRFEKFAIPGVENCVQLAKGDASNEPYNVVTHGDPWFGNFMFRYDQEGSGILDVKFLDFQQARYTSPALDLGRLLFVLMDKAARARHRDELLRCYHDSLSETLRVLGSDPDELFPFCVIESQLKKYADYFVVCSTFNLMHTLSECQSEFNGESEFKGESGEEMLKSISCVQQKITPYGRRRLVEVVQECVELGYL